jgi:DNA-binding MarR family transcriptional regulator
MQERDLVLRELNPASARSAVVRLLPAGRRAVEAAAPLHVDAVRRHLVDLFTPDELDTLAALNERILGHLADEPFPGDGGPGDPSA